MYWGKGGGDAGTYECEHLVSDKNLQFTFSQAIRGVSPSIPYVFRCLHPPPPTPHPRLGAEGLEFLLCPLR